MKVVTIDEMRQLEEACASLGLTSDVLMKKAGKAVAEQVRSTGGEQQEILLLVGPGNNGGDGLVAARHLHEWGARVTVYLLGERSDDDPNLKLVRERSIACVEAAADSDQARLGQLLSSTDAVVDAIFGTGRSRPLDGAFRQALEAVSSAQSSQPSLHSYALDLPSGLDADTGAADAACLHVDDTITLGLPKLGLFNAPGAERAGQITVVDIGIPDHLTEQVQVELITEEWARSALPERPMLANKGTFGRVLVVAGSDRYVGAAYLACSGAMRVGAGLVTLAVASSLQPVLAAKLTETTYLPLPEESPGGISPDAAETIRQELDSYDVLLMGCGLGQSPPVKDFIKTVLFSHKPAGLSLVLDADALNTLAEIPDWWQRLPDDAILTPHPGEMSRLVGMPTEQVQADRIGVARRAAREWQKTVVLKGAYTVVAAPDGQCRINPMANPGLASAGTGDVLAGAMAGLRGQGLSPWDAAACGAYLHGQAGEVVRARLGDAGMMATDLLPVLPWVIRQLKEDSGALFGAEGHVADD